MPRNPLKAVAYYRTSSAANVGDGKDSLARQKAAVEGYAKSAGMVIADEFYDPAVSGADPIQDRPGFADLLDRIAGNGVGAVLVEDASRFARDLIVQLTGHDRLRALGVELIPANAPEHFREDTPTAVLVRQVLGAISQFEKAQIVAKLKAARDRKRAATGRCEGRKPVPAEVVKIAKRLARTKTPLGMERSLRMIAKELAALGHHGPSGSEYGPESVKRMLAA